MPTKKDLENSWRAQFNLELNDDEYYCRDYGGYNPECFEDSDDLDYEKDDLNGRVIGTIYFDPKDQEMHINFDENEESDLEKNLKKD